MQCKNCGATYDDYESHCPYCGSDNPYEYEKRQGKEQQEDYERMKEFQQNKQETYDKVVKGFALFHMIFYVIFFIIFIMVFCFIMYTMYQMMHFF